MTVITDSYSSRWKRQRRRGSAERGATCDWVGLWMLSVLLWQCLRCVKKKKWEVSVPELETNDPWLKSVMSARCTASERFYVWLHIKLVWAVTPKWAFFIVVLRVMNQKIILGTGTITSSIISKLIPSGRYRLPLLCGKETYNAHSDIYFKASLVLFVFSTCCSTNWLFLGPWYWHEVLPALLRFQAGCK